ncbi:hypothetical protein VSS37_11065 [Candidatus Thiothrix sp. Deng01]|uniref:CopG family transcriptional regulator n=1 Tax=Candidatus Thiothrix phosphatis TaxID=3112415 RepID=A0ABU6CXG9_9GAMM|nr:hypothetical protein [Candidatus Thiothrix sp. Deng01]MEB4591522.1 hypothetical protein [Candidatus Thiothrix sp. Deng01]
MSTTTTQISAYISEDTKGQIESYVKRRGVTKAFIIESALQHFLQVLREIPEDVIIPARLVITESSMLKLAERLESDEEPTPALRALMASK